MQGSLYDPRAWRDATDYLPSDGDQAVTFQTCGKAKTGYAGGFVVVPPARCAVFTVYVGADEYRITRGLAFGGRVPCGCSLGAS
jgi:hypothetical protein